MGNNMTWKKFIVINIILFNFSIGMASILKLMKQNNLSDFICCIYLLISGFCALYAMIKLFIKGVI